MLSPTPHAAVSGRAASGESSAFDSGARPRSKPTSIGSSTDAYASARPEEPWVMAASSAVTREAFQNRRAVSASKSAAYVQVQHGSVFPASLLLRLRTGSYQISLMKRSLFSTPNWMTMSTSR